MTKINRKITEEIDWRIRVFDSLSFPTLILKPNRDILSANQIFIEEYGGMKEVVGKKCHQVFNGSQESCSPDVCPLPRVLSEKKGHSTMKRIKTGTGQIRWEDRVFSPILNDNGEVAYIIESVRDVTKVKIL